MTNTSWSKLQKKYNLSKNKIYSALKGKRIPGGSQYQQKRKQTMKLNSTTSSSELLMLLGYLMCNVLLAWATLQQPYLSKSLSSPQPQNPNKWIHSVIFEPQLKIQLTHF